jgi:hypothetical protein
MITHGNPGVAITLNEDTPPIVNNAVPSEIAPLYTGKPKQVAGLIPLSGCCSGTVQYSRRLIGTVASYTKNNVSTSVGTVFATLGALDVFFYNLGWSKTDSWYYIVTEDEWVINKTGADGLSQPTFTLMPCDDECRDECISYSNPVFGVVGATEGTYENDVNSFLIDAALIDALDTAQLRFIIQKQVGSIWSDLGFLDDSLGEETDFGSVTSHPT